MGTCDGSYLNEYIKVKEIARGLRGTIRAVRNKNNQQLFCAKTIRRNQKGKSVQDEIDAEIDALEKLAEVGGVVDLVEVYQTPRETTLILALHQKDLHHVIESEEKVDAKRIL